MFISESYINYQENITRHTEFDDEAFVDISLDWSSRRSQSNADIPRGKASEKQRRNSKKYLSKSADLLYKDKKLTSVQGYDGDTDSDSTDTPTELASPLAKCEICGLDFMHDILDSNEHKIFSSVRKRKSKRKRKLSTNYNSLHKSPPPFSPPLQRIDFDDYKESKEKMEVFAPDSERKWTLQYQFKGDSPLLAKVIIGRGQRDDYPELNNIHLIQETKDYAQTEWRNSFLKNIKKRNNAVKESFSLVPSVSTCLFCFQERNHSILENMRNDPNHTLNKPDWNLEDYFQNLDITGSMRLDKEHVFDNTPPTRTQTRPSTNTHTRTPNPSNQQTKAPRSYGSIANTSTNNSSKTRTNKSLNIPAEKNKSSRRSKSPKKSPKKSSPTKEKTAKKSAAKKETSLPTKTTNNISSKERSLNSSSDNSPSHELFKIKRRVLRSNSVTDRNATNVTLEHRKVDIDLSDDYHHLSMQSRDIPPRDAPISVEKTAVEVPPKMDDVVNVILMYADTPRRRSLSNVETRPHNGSSAAAVINGGTIKKKNGISKSLFNKTSQNTKKEKGANNSTVPSTNSITTNGDSRVESAKTKVSSETPKVSSETPKVSSETPKTIVKERRKHKRSLSEKLFRKISVTKKEPTINYDDEDDEEFVIIM